MKHKHEHRVTEIEISVYIRGWVVDYYLQVSKTRSDRKAAADYSAIRLMRGQERGRG